MPSPPPPLSSLACSTLCCSVIVLFRCRRREAEGDRRQILWDFRCWKNYRGRLERWSPPGIDLIWFDLSSPLGNTWSPYLGRWTSFNIRDRITTPYWCVCCERLRQNNGCRARHNGLLKGRMMGCWMVGGGDCRQRREWVWWLRTRTDIAEQKNVHNFTIRS